MYSMTCTFCEIVSGNLPARVVKETEHTLAFLDIDPIQKGHVLIIPKQHAYDLTAMTEIETNEVMAICKEVMISLRESYNPDSISILQSNGECMDVPHVHFHVIPRFIGDGFGLIEPEISVSENEMNEIARQLRVNMLQFS